MHSCKAPGSLPANLAAGCALLLLCLLAAAPVAEAGPRCPSGLLCPDDTWFCCAPGRESCCKNIGTGGPFGRRLKTVEMLPSEDPLLPPIVNIWQGGRLLHTTTSSANRHLSQSSEPSSSSPSDDDASTAQQGAQLSERMSAGVAGDRDNPIMNTDIGRRNRVTPMQLAMTGTATGRGPVPKGIVREGFYAERDLEVRPAVGGDSRLERSSAPREGNAKKGVPGPYTLQQTILRRGTRVADREPRDVGLGK